MGKEDRRFYPIPLETQAPPEYGIDAHSLKLKTINLAVARATPQRIEVAGSMLWAVDATSLGALANVYLGDAMLASDPLPVRHGFFMRGLRFSRIYITNLAQAGETITLAVADEGIDNIQIENPAVLYSQIDLVKATVLDTVADVTLVAAAAAAVVLAANANRRAAIICSLTANTQTIRIGDASIGAARGVELSPGDSITIEATEAIYGYTGAGANQVLAIAWTAD